MHTRPLIALAATAALTFAAAAAAQVRSITTIPQPARQAPPAGVATFGAPSPTGLASPSPAQLMPPGLPSLTPPGVPNLSSPGTPPGSPVVDAGVAQPVAIGGGGASYAPTSAVAAGTNVMGYREAPRGPMTAVDVARAFLDADTNRDGELSRNEALRLGPMSAAFDDLDRNRDGVLSRFEFDDAFR